MKLLREIAYEQYPESIILIDESAPQPILLEAEKPLNDQRELKHLHHAEDLLIVGGDKGFDDIISAFGKTHDYLLGRKRNGYSIQTKFDGCIHENTQLITNNGLMTIKDIIEKKDNNIQILQKDLTNNKEVFSNILNFVVKKSNKKWLAIEFESCDYVLVTEDHEFHTSNRGWVKAKELNENDNITEKM